MTTDPSERANTQPFACFPIFPVSNVRSIPPTFTDTVVTFEIKITFFLSFIVLYSSVQKARDDSGFPIVFYFLSPSSAMSALYSSIFLFLT